MTAAMYQKIDTDKNGTICFQEYFAYRAKGGQVPAELKAKYLKEFKAIDTDGNDKLSFEEMIAYLLSKENEVYSVSMLGVSVKPETAM